MYKRITIDIILFLSLFIMPWWVSYAIAIVGIFFFADFYEIIALGFIIDIVYGTPNTLFFGIQFANTLSAVLLFAAVTFIKNRMRFYQS